MWPYCAVDAIDDLQAERDWLIQEFAETKEARVNVLKYLTLTEELYQTLAVAEVHATALDTALALAETREKKLREALKSIADYAHDPFRVSLNDAIETARAALEGK